MPKSVTKDVRDIIDGATSNAAKELAKIELETEEFNFSNNPGDFAKLMSGLEKEMYDFAENLEFEQAARTRDRIEELRTAYLKR
ncbi:MAG: hypothetical protein HKN85_00580 [Gammaproteobacteria bacterium]|nr:hypothetical protein [Gammaproteobacteria bacterium]